MDEVEVCEVPVRNRVSPSRILARHVGTVECDEHALYRQTPEIEGVLGNNLLILILHTA